jgi:hypothetical protein
MIYKEDLNRLRENEQNFVRLAEAEALRKKVEELEAKIEILTQQIMTNDIYE